jgi:hypothetical protein
MKQKIGVMNGRAIKFAFRNGEDVGHLDELRLAARIRVRI